MRFNLYVFILLIATQYSCQTNGANNTNNDSSSTKTLSISIDVDLSNPKPVEPLLYGFSTAAMYWQMNATSDTFLNAVSELKPRLLRFPGGTLGEFYHWNKPGYGLDYEEVKQHNVSYAESLKAQNAYEAKRGARYVDEFVTLAKRLDCDVIVCANMLTGSVDEMTSLLNYLKQNGVNVPAVELGNEIYLPKLQKFYKTPKSYIDACKPYAAALRQQFPNIKIGVTAAPYMKISDEPGENDKISDYYKSFNDALAKENFYDAYIVHYYFPFECASVSDNCSLQRLNDIMNNQLPKSYAYYTKLFGTNRKQWITEWNIATASTKGKYGNTALQALFIQEFYHKLNELNAQYNNVVNMATYQTLAGNVIGSNMLMEPFKREQYRDDKYGNVIRRAPWFANALVEPVYTNNMKLVNASISPSNENISVYTYTNSNNEVLVYILNKSNDELNVNEIKVNGKQLKNIAAKFIQPDSSSSGFGWNKASGAAAASGNIKFEQKTVDLPMRINGFGCGYLRGTHP